MYEYIETNIRDIQSRVAQAARKAGREMSEIEIVAVSKTFPPEIIMAALKYGLSDIGESKIQEAESKIKSIGKAARWHMIGHLQTNKAKKAVEMFDMIQSLDSMKLAEDISHAAGKMGKRIDCLLEINSSGEITKSGIGPSATLDLIKSIGGLTNINLCGLMTIGPFTDDEQQIRRAFRLTRELFLRGREANGESFAVLSMGMSSDFEIAIEEGSNMVRIGTAIFGRRT